MNKIEWINYQNKRLDKTVAEYCCSHEELREIIPSREMAKKLIRSGNISIQSITQSKTGTILDPDMMLKEGDAISITLPHQPVQELKNLDAELSINTGLSILYEDNYLVVVDKSAGIATHKGAGTSSSVNELLNSSYGYELEYINRLDKETSGLVLFAKNRIAKIEFSRLFAERNLNKYYIAICWRAPREFFGTIKSGIQRSRFDRQKMAISLDGKESETTYNVTKIYGNKPEIKSHLDARASIIDCKPITGRSHQIRVHLSSIGASVVGDKIYGNQPRGFQCDSHCLHSYGLELVHPFSNIPLSLSAPIPERLSMIKNFLETTMISTEISSTQIDF